MYCSSGLCPSTMNSQGCSDNCTGLIKLPEWPHSKALQSPDKNHIAWPRALKGKGKGGKKTFRKCIILSPVKVMEEQHLHGLAESRAWLLLVLTLNKGSQIGQASEQMVTGSPMTLRLCRRSHFPSDPVSLSHSALPLQSSLHSLETPKAPKAHSTCATSNVIFWLAPSISLITT